MIYSLQIPKYVQSSFDSTEIGMLQLQWGGGNILSNKSLGKFCINAHLVTTYFPSIIK